MCIEITCVYNTLHLHCSGVVKLTNKLNNTPFDDSDEEVFQVGIRLPDHFSVVPYNNYPAFYFHSSTHITIR